MSTSITNTCSKIISEWKHGQCDSCGADLRGTCIAKRFQIRRQPEGSQQHFCSVKCVRAAKSRIRNLYATRESYCTTHGSDGTLLWRYASTSQTKLSKLVTEMPDEYSEIKTVFKKHFPSYEFQGE